MCEWLWFFSYAEFIITDSFHATCFSLILNKDFLTFKRFETPKFAKLSTVLNNIGLPYRLFDDSDLHTCFATLRPIDWPKINKTLDKWRSECVSFIDKALSAQDSVIK
jgi:hypothetical protein